MKGKQRLKSLSQEKQIQLFSFLRGLEAKAHKFLTAMSPAIAMVDKNKQDGYGFGAEYAVLVETVLVPVLVLHRSLSTVFVRTPY